jgi:hypothetical protein
MLHLRLIILSGVADMCMTISVCIVFKKDYKQVIYNNFSAERDHASRKAPLHESQRDRVVATSTR